MRIPLLCFSPLVIATLLGGTLFVNGTDAHSSADGASGGSVLVKSDGGFHSPMPALRTVGDAHQLQHGRQVSVQGFIIDRIAGDKYEFRGVGEADTIVVEINQDKWQGLVVQPDDIVLISGRMHEDHSQGYSHWLNVDSIRKLSAPIRAKADEVPAALSIDKSKGGFVGSGRLYYRIQDVQVLPSGSAIQVSGSIAQRINGDNYLLREPNRSDKAGNHIAGDRIVVEIGDDLWQGQVVRVEDRVQIVGEVRRSDGIATIKAQKVTKDLEYARRRDALNERLQEQQSPLPVQQLHERQRRLRQSEQQPPQSGGQMQRQRRLRQPEQQQPQEDAREVARIFVNETLETPLTMYRINMGNYPTTEQGLAVLLEAPAENAANWHGPYVKILPNDPWGNPYQYRFPGTRNLRSYDVWSYGPDGVESDDDITNWSAASQAD